jgi:phage/plasmid-associated DNA primase
MIEFTGNFLTLLVCNNIPDCDDIDAAFSKRLRCINFPNHFTENPTKPNEKKLISNINENFEKWKYDMMKLLIDYYKIYVKDRSLVPTEKILKWTNMYKENTDIYLQFINEHMEDSANKKDKLHCSQLYGIFKDWFKNNNPNTKVPNNKIFIDGLRKHKTIEKVNIDGVPQLGIRNVILLDEI